MNDSKETHDDTMTPDSLRKLLKRFDYSFRVIDLSCHPHPDLNDFYALKIEATWKTFYNPQMDTPVTLTCEIHGIELYQALKSLTKQLKLASQDQILDQLKTIETKIDQLLEK